MSMILSVIYRLLAGSLFVVNSFVVNLPLKLVLSLVPKDQLRKWYGISWLLWTRQDAFFLHRLRLALKLLMLTRTFTYLRGIGVKYGLHSRWLILGEVCTSCVSSWVVYYRVGSLLPYLRQLPVVSRSCYGYVSQWAWRRQSTASCSDKTDADSDRPSGMELCWYSEVVCICYRLCSVHGCW